MASTEREPTTEAWVAPIGVQHLKYESVLSIFIQNKGQKLRI